MTPRPRLTVVVPTYQRREVVWSSLQALGRQDSDEPFDVVVVVDGSTDGTGDAIRATRWPFALHLIEQENAGLAVARNRGAQAARGDILLFLDDDMESHPGLIGAHLDAHHRGAEAVVGAMPLHPQSPRSILSEGAGRWADRLARRCAQPGYVLGPDDIFGGQLSIQAELFRRLGEFDERFTAGGEFGNEDVDLSHRLVAGGHRVVFRADAVTYQRFVVTPAEYLRRLLEVGKADMMLARMHQDLDPALRAATLRSAPSGLLERIVLGAPRLVHAVMAPLRRLGILLVDRGMHDLFTVRLWPRLHRMAYWSGIARAGGPLDGTRVRVLCWHALTDLSSDRLLAPYGVPPGIFSEQLDTLRRAGWATLSPEEFVRFAREGAPVPRRAVFVTFDDCTADLATDGRPILRDKDVPAAAFPVTGCVGDRNRWDEHLGVTRLSLADWSALRSLQDGGMAIGAHSRTHPMLPRVDDDTLWAEVAGPRQDLLAHGFPAPVLFAYPHGEHDQRVRTAVSRAGYRCAFTVAPGVATRSTDLLAIPRLEVTPRDRGWRLRMRVRAGGRPPALWRSPAGHRAAARSLRRRLARALRSVVPRAARAWTSEESWH